MGTIFLFYSEAIFKKNFLIYVFYFWLPWVLPSLGFPLVAASGVWSSSPATGLSC